jgi:hypothetical protein
MPYYSSGGIKMAENEKNGEFTKGVVVLLDALGTKGIWNRLDPKEIINNWRSVSDDIQKSIVPKHEKVRRAWNTAIDKEKVGLPMGGCEVKIFSDTVFITLVGEDPINVELMGAYLTGPFCRAFLKRIFFRGVVSVGQFYKSETLLLGPAVDEAAEWYAHPNWIGISAAPSAKYLIEQNSNSNKNFEAGTLDDSDIFVKYDIPLKNGVDKNGWALAWPIHLNEYSGDKKYLKDRVVLLQCFAGQSISLEAAPKYKNTLDFFDLVMEKIRKMTKQICLIKFSFHILI